MGWWALLLVGVLSGACVNSIGVRRDLMAESRRSKRRLLQLEQRFPRTARLRDEATDPLYLACTARCDHLERRSVEGCGFGAAVNRAKCLAMADQLVGRCLVLCDALRPE